MSKKEKMPTSEKYLLNIQEAADYFSIGIKKMRRLAEDNLGIFGIYSGNRYLVIRSKFEEFLQNNPILEEDEEVVMESIYNREQLNNKDILNIEESVFLFHLSRRKFRDLLEREEDLPFIAFYRKRKIIIRVELENYLEANPEIKEELKSGKSRISEKKRRETQSVTERRIDQG